VQGVVIADPVYANGEFLLVMTDEGKVTTFSADSGTRLNVDDPHGDSSTLEKAPSDRPEIIRNYGDFYALTPDGLLYSLPVRSLTESADRRPLTSAGPQPDGAASAPGASSLAYSTVPSRRTTADAVGEHLRPP
jgi:hypothetical protein